jgi:hypothetical protein
MPLKRTNAVRYRTDVNDVIRSSRTLNLDDSDNGSEVDESVVDDIDDEAAIKEQYIKLIFGEGEAGSSKLDSMRESIAYVYIRAHSALPYDKKKEEHFDIYKMPSDMNLSKITAAPNGDYNSNFYEYQDKKKIIGLGITAFESEVSKGKEENDTFTAAAYICGILKRFEKKQGINDYKQRNIISQEKKVLNKIIVPLSIKEQKEKKDYFVVQILFFNKKTNDFDSFDIYPYIHKIYREYTNRLILGHNDAIKIADIINFLYEYLLLRNVVLLDFSCSSYPAGVINQTELNTYLNDNDLHGGKSKKSKKNKTKKIKRTKKNKNTKKKNKKI